MTKNHLVSRSKARTSWRHAPEAGAVAEQAVLCALHLEVHCARLRRSHTSGFVVLKCLRMTCPSPFQAGAGRAARVPAQGRPANAAAALSAPDLATICNVKHHLNAARLNALSVCCRPSISISNSSAAPTSQCSYRQPPPCHAAQAITYILLQDVRSSSIENTAPHCPVLVSVQHRRAALLGCPGPRVSFINSIIMTVTGKHSPPRTRRCTAPPPCRAA